MLADIFTDIARAATFGWLCVETIAHRTSKDILEEQPPSGGCVLKHRKKYAPETIREAATFGWLCVETIYTTIYTYRTWQPPSGGCVLKHFFFVIINTVN